MKAIMKSQLYQLKKERLLYIVFALCIVLLLIFILNEDGHDTFGEIICEMSSILPQISLMFLFAAVAVICGKDFLDKTGNYEIMGGHTRLEMYLGRAILAIGVAVLGSILVILFIIGFGSLLFGWGDAISITDVLMRVLLLTFPMFRIACEVVFLTFIVRNAYMVLAAGFVYLFFIVELLFGMAGANADSYYLGMSNIIKLLNMNSFATYSPVNPGVKLIVYDTTLKVSDVGKTIVVSVAVGILFLVLGYHFFKTDDIE